MRGSLLLLGLALIVLVPGPALATGPLPHQVVTLAPGDQDVAIVRSEVSEKREEIEEECTPRPVVLCVGPFDPDINHRFGTTGVRLITNDTNATAGHDPSRTWEYGPYSFPQVILEEIRVCNSGCSVPNSLYAHAQGNVTFIVYVFGTEYRTTWGVGPRDVGVYRPGVLEPSCELQRWYDCTSLV